MISGPADVTKPPIYSGIMSCISAKPVRLGFSGTLLVPAPVTNPSAPLRSTLVPIPIVSSLGSFSIGFNSPQPQKVISLNSPSKGRA